MGSGEASGATQILFDNQRLAVGRFTCPPGHPLWSRDNVIGPRPLIAFPGPSVEIRMAGRRSIVAHAGVAALYEARHTYRRALVDGRGDRCVFVAAAPEWMREALAASDPAARERSQVFAAPRAPVTPATYLARGRLVAGLEAGELSPLAAEEGVVALLGAVLAGVRPAAAEPRAEHQALTYALERRVAERFCEDDDLAALAGAAGCSPWHAARVFRACTGASLHALRDRLRVSAALERLGGEVDLAGLALELGYSSHSHFTTAFRRVFGCPPSAVRSASERRRLRASAASRILKAGPRGAR